MRRMTDGHDRAAAFVGRKAIAGRFVLLAAAVLTVVGFLAAGSVAWSATGSSATVSLGKTKLGLVLVNSKRHTLYLSGKDKNGTSACSASCAQIWPPLLSKGKPSAGPGVKASLLGTTKRSNGSLQVTYNKHPLYTFASDTQAGQTNGEGVASFYAVSAKGSAILKAPAAPTTTTPTTPTRTY